MFLATPAAFLYALAAARALQGPTRVGAIAAAVVCGVELLLVLLAAVGD